MHPRSLVRMDGFHPKFNLSRFRDGRNFENIGRQYLGAMIEGPLFLWRQLTTTKACTICSEKRKSAICIFFTVVKIKTVKITLEPMNGGGGDPEGQTKRKSKLALAAAGLYHFIGFQQRQQGMQPKGFAQKAYFGKTDNYL